MLWEEWERTGLEWTRPTTREEPWERWEETGLEWTQPSILEDLWEEEVVEEQEEGLA